MNNNRVITFTRNPVLGKVKTRLAKTIGNEAALEVYKFLMQHTCKVLEQVPANRAVYYSEAIAEQDIWDSKTFKKCLQHGATLGDKMANAFTAAFNANYTKVVIVGSDLYHLKPNHITEAFSALDKHDVVIGPAEDGGYYLLGLTQFIPEVFINKDWGTSTVFKDTMNDVKHKSVHVLEVLNDIDVYDDMKDIDSLKQFIPVYD